MKTAADVIDTIVIGSGMGGMTAGALLAKHGFDVLILEAAHVPGGCSSSFKRKGYTFESGATTLIGFDEHQPLRWLEQALDIRIPRVKLKPSMQCHINGAPLTRYQDLDDWIAESTRFFGNEEGQRQFWELAYRISKQVWEISGRYHFFPPTEFKDLLKLADPNAIRYAPILPYAFKSVAEMASKFGIYTDTFRRFLDEQLMITAQSVSEDTPFLFGSPALTYTNFGNYYVPGGLLEMVRTLQQSLEANGGALKTKEKVVALHQLSGSYLVKTNKAEYRANRVVSNLPVWNMAEITTGAMQAHFRKVSRQYERAWGAFTMGVVVEDCFADGLPLHHQVVLDASDGHKLISGESIFVSMSHPDDARRTPEGERVLNVSCHTRPEWWFNLNGDYDQAKSSVEEFILDRLDRKLPGFQRDTIKVAFSSTPVTWQNWVYRAKGKVGGLPQSMGRSLLDWPAANPPFKNLYLCGDTVFPGQGIPGVTLSGINVYHRVNDESNKTVIS